MRKAIAIAELTLRLQWRSGMLAGGSLLTAAVAAFVFFMASADSDATAELQVRIQYAYVLAYSLLTLYVVAAAVYAVRSQIDGRQFHQLDAHPVSRVWILLGKWLGVSLGAAVMQLTLLATLLGCAMLYLRQAPEAERSAAVAYYSSPRAEIMPDVPELRDEAKRRLDGLVRDGKVDPDTVTEEVWSNMLDVVRREQQLVAAGASRTWQFDVARFAGSGKDLTLRYRFVARSGEELITGSWVVENESGLAPLTIPFFVNAYVETDLTIPAANVPDSGQISLTLNNASGKDLVINRQTGLRILVPSGSLWSNLSAAASIQAMHLAVVSAVGLATGVAFTFSVAAFVSIVLFIVAASAGFFRGLAYDLSGRASGFLDWLSVYLMRGGTWLAEGVRPPPIGTALGQGIEIPVAAVMQQWGLAVIFYGIVMLALAAYLACIKELDKLQAGQQ